MQEREKLRQRVSLEQVEMSGPFYNFTTHSGPFYNFKHSLENKQC